MIHPVEATTSLFSHTRPLRRADLPATGTPTGVGYALIGQVRGSHNLPAEIKARGQPTPSRWATPR